MKDLVDRSRDNQSILRLPPSTINLIFRKTSRTNVMAIAVGDMVQTLSGVPNFGEDALNILEYDIGHCTINFLLWQ